MMFKAAQKST
jgi:enoyl-CoA hydratase/carnithine racemase